MAVTSVTAIVTNFIVDGSTPANNNTFYVAFFANDGSYSSSLAVNADITQTSQQVCNAISTAVANAVNTALGTSLTSSNVLLLNRPSDGTGTIASGTLASGSIGNVQVASGGFGSGAVGSGQIGWAHLSSGAVRSGHIGDAAVVSGSYASGSIASGHIASGFIFFLQTGLASGSVTSGEIGDNAVTSGNIASGAIGSPHLASGAVLSGDIGNNAVTSGNIASGQVFTFHIASGGLLSGAIGSGQVGPFAVAWSLMGASAAASGAVQSGNIASGSIGSFHLGSGGVVRSGSIGSGAVTGQAGAGAFVVASGTIGTFDIGSGAVVSGRIASGSVGAFHIAWATVGAAAAASGAILSGNIASGQVGKFHFASGGIVQSGTVGSGAVAGQRGGLSIGIASGTVGHFDFGSGAIQSGDIASGQVGESHIASGTAVDAAAHVIDDFSAGGSPLLTEENVSGFVAVCVSQSGRIRVAMPAVSGRMPAVGFAVSGALSGQACSFWTDGFFQIPANSGSYDFSGRLGGLLYITRSGQIGPLSGGFSSGGFLSGDITQRVGTIINSGGVRVMLAPFTKDSVISTPGTFWIASGDIASGQVGFGHLANASVQSGTIASGQVAGWHLASGVINAISGNVTVSGSLTSLKYVMGFDLSLNPVVGHQSVIMTWWGMQLRGNQQSNIDVASGAVEPYGSGNVFSVGIPIQKSSGAVGLAIISASGQVGDMTAWYGSGGASGGLLGTVFAAINASGTFRGSLASGMVATYGRNDYEDTFIANEAISGLVAVALDSGGINVVRAQPGSGLRMPAIGISVTNVVSGAICPFISFGKLLVAASGSLAGSGFTGIQNTAYVGSGGLLVNQSGYVTGASSGGGPGVAGTSGRIVQRVGTFISGGIMVEVDRSMTSGLIALPGGAPSY